MLAGFGCRQAFRRTWRIGGRWLGAEPAAVALHCTNERIHRAQGRAAWPLCTQQGGMPQQPAKHRQAIVLDQNQFSDRHTSGYVVICTALPRPSACISCLDSPRCRGLRDIVEHRSRHQQAAADMHALLTQRCAPPCTAFTGHRRSPTQCTPEHVGRLSASSLFHVGAVPTASLAPGVLHTPVRIRRQLIALRFCR